MKSNAHKELQAAINRVAYERSRQHYTTEKSGLTVLVNSRLRDGSGPSAVLEELDKMYCEAVMAQYKPRTARRPAG